MVEFITHHDLPTVLYKYYAPPSPKIQYSEENLKTLLRAGKIRLTNGLEVNDLFECDPYVVWDDVTPDVTYQYAKWLWESNDPQTADPRTALRKTYPTLCSLREAKPKLYQDVTTDKETTTQNTLKVMSFCCLTAVSDSILMWAHYAADHYGVCIGFSTKYFQFPAAALPIDYEQKRPCMSAKDNFFNTSRGEKFKCEVFKTFSALIFTPTKYIKPDICSYLNGKPFLKSFLVLVLPMIPLRKLNQWFLI